MSTLWEGLPCERSDCRLQSSGGVSTCLAYSPTYDRAGNRVDSGDPNTHWHNVACLTCSKRWTVSTKGTNTSWIEEP